MKKILPFIFVIISAGAYAQNADSIYSKVDTEAAFRGGEKKWREYLSGILNPAIPLDNGAPAGTYTVIVQFIVHINGEISEIKALTNHGYGMEKEAIRVIRKGPKWIPAQVNGNPVKAYRKQPITFQILSDD